ncbi:MAG TPA: 5'-nucleotidase C-terminal domain-containing protein [Chloroflexota bacterium]|nr:5'-nucleotidase C-terminal domain-containing protein [Chloroflexota bacterium]
MASRALLALALLLGSLGLGGVYGAARAETPIRITLLHDTHFHGEFESANGRGADPAAPLTLAHYVGLVQQLRAANPRTLFVGVGDDLAPSLYSALFQGAHMVAALNAAGLDANTFGNHEFDYGPDVLRARILESTFPWISANVRDRRSGTVFAADLGVRPFLLRDLDGVIVGLTGLTTADTPQLSSPGPDVEVLDPLEAARTVVAQMRAAGAQLVVVLSHLAWPESERLAGEVPGIDVIVGDHASTVLPQPRVIKGTLVARRGDGFALLGQLDLEVQAGRVTGWRYTAHPVRPDGPVDATVAQVMASYGQLLAQALDEVIGVSTTPLDARTEAVRTRETNLGNLVADALRAWGDADVGLQNGGGLRSDRVYPAGPLTRRDLAAILPFANYAAKVRLSGAALWETLEHSVGALDERAGRFLQVSGLTFCYDPAAPAGQRVRRVWVGDAPLDPAAQYTVALNDYLQRGGDGYTMLAAAEVLIPSEGGPLLTTLVADYVAARGTVQPRVEGRIQALAASTSDDLTATELGCRPPAAVR